MGIRKALLASGITAVLVGSFLLISRTDLIARITGRATIFGALTSQVRSIRASRIVVQLFEGLPHPSREKQTFESELKSSDTLELAGHKFYPDAIDVDSAISTTLREVLTDPDSFYPVTGVKFCGGFHPDWLVAFDNMPERVEFCCCFGCKEVEIRCRREHVRLNMSESAATLLPKLLDRHRSKRPAFGTIQRAHE